jgi:hypothetical protein
MVVQFSVEVNRKRQAKPLADLAGSRLLPSSKPAILRVFYSGTDTASGRSRRLSLEAPLHPGKYAPYNQRLVNPKGIGKFKMTGRG